MSQPEAAFYHRTVGSNGYWTSYLKPDLEVLDHPSPEGLEDDFTIGRFSLCNFGMTLEQDSALLSPVTVCINSFQRVEPEVKARTIVAPDVAGTPKGVLAEVPKLRSNGYAV